jgi:opacity protein-like surface antigen
MPKFLLITAAIAALCATPAFAADDVMASTFGNTIVSTGGMSEVHTHYRADHSFDMAASMMGMSRTFKGTWALDGKGNLCRTFDGEAPPDTANPLCLPIAAHKLGDTWTVEANGKTRTATLRPGIQ